VDTAQVILPKQATPWYQFVFWRCGPILHREKSSLSGTPARKKPCFGWSFSGRRCRFWEVSFFKNKFFCDLFYRKAGIYIVIY
jgi:hypothetical protein